MSLCEEEKNKSHMLLKCEETKNWTETFVNQKWLQVNEEITYRKLISNTETLELENLGKFLYKTKCKWEHKIENLMQNGE
jgi:hypothetical protein